MLLKSFILECKILDQNALNAISRFTGELRRRYPNHIGNDLLWVPLSASGLHLKVQFLYADLTEYVAVFSAIGDSSGRSG